MPNNPKVSIHLPTRWGGQIPRIDELTEFCRRADELRFATLWVYDMIFHSVKSLDVVPRDVVYRREAGVVPPMPPCGRR